MRFFRNTNLIQCLSPFLLLLILSAFISGCKDDDDQKEEIVFGTMTDIEGNAYRTVQIGNQCWMADDLRTSTFRSGVTINRVDGDNEWANTVEPAYCIYKDSPLAPGYLYNYHVVTNSENVAPEGWHIPTDEEWKELEAFLGLASSELDKTNWRGTNEGDKLKIEGLEGWLFYDGVWGTNETGFSAYGGSSRFYEGPFGIPGLKGSSFWWSTSDNDGYGWYRYLDYQKSGIFRYHGHPNYGFSIRCIKDK